MKKFLLIVARGFMWMLLRILLPMAVLVLLVKYGDWILLFVFHGFLFAAFDVVNPNGVFWTGTTILYFLLVVAAIYGIVRGTYVLYRKHRKISDKALQEARESWRKDG